MISGFARTYNLDPHYVKDNYTLTDILMYGAVLPSYDTNKDNAPKFDKSKDANNPDNFNDSDEDEIIVK